MRYPEDKEKSAEYLRQALPHMTRQIAPLHPISYAVWYEYVAGMNPPLQAALDELIATSQLLDDEQTVSLFRQYIADIDEATAQRVAQGFQNVLNNVSRSMEQAGDQAHQFGNALEQWSGGLGDSASGRDQLISDTRQMQKSMSELKANLADSRAEVERLRQEVVRARQESLSDGLTGLTNRRGFDQALAACLADGPHREMSLLLTDIDHFKHINDNFGHLFGDRVIRAVADILKANIKGKDLAARYGGEEFVVLLPDTDLKGAQIVAEKIRSTVASARIRRINSNEVLSNVTVSLGVSSYQPGEPLANFVDRADQALYESKNLGRNRVTVAAAN